MFRGLSFILLFRANKLLIIHVKVLTKVIPPGDNFLKEVSPYSRAKFLTFREAENLSFYGRHRDAFRLSGVSFRRYQTAAISTE